MADDGHSMVSFKTRIKMALPSSYPHVQALTALATSIAALAP
jgi:hypothetical protein